MIERAAHIFFSKKFTTENDNTCLNKINNTEEIQLCYEANPLKPRIMSDYSNYRNQEEYHLYPTTEELEQMSL